MKKLVKWFSIFAVIGTAIGLAVAYFCKNSSDIPEENDPAETEDDDFDLDADLQPASDREYVSLKRLMMTQMANPNHLKKIVQKYSVYLLFYTQLKHAGT